MKVRHWNPSFGKLGRYDRIRAGLSEDLCDRTCTIMCPVRSVKVRAGFTYFQKRCPYCQCVGLDVLAKNRGYMRCKPLPESILFTHRPVLRTLSRSVSNCIKERNELLTSKYPSQEFRSGSLFILVFVGYQPFDYWSQSLKRRVF